MSVKNKQTFTEFPFQSCEKTREMNPVSDINWITDLEKGDLLLKMTLRVIRRTHDGECSDYWSEFSSDDYKEDDDNDEKSFEAVLKTKTIYFQVPDNFDMNWIDKEGNVISNEDTEFYFQEWREPSNCGGLSGVCHLEDTLIPISIEYVKIV